MRTLTRRQFLTVHDAAARRERPRAVVCVFLRGAADTLNLVVPTGDDAYYRARPSIAIPAASTERIGEQFGFHPKMAPLVPAFREGRLAVVQAVGSDDTSGSHFEAQDLMEHGAASGDLTTGGWIGRYLRATAPDASTPLAAVAIGATLPESLRGAASASVIASVDEVGLQAPGGDAARAARALAALYGADAGILGEPAREALGLLERVEAIKAAPYRPANGAVYPDGPFGSGLREVSRLVKAGVGLRVACVDLDGWDTHFVQGGVDGLQAGLIATFAGGLGALDADLGELRHTVTVVAMTEFGRRIYENSSGGTDHGRGFAMFVLGGGVRGGRVIGADPGLDEEEGPIGPGGVRVLVDYRAVLAAALGLREPGVVFPGLKAAPELAHLMMDS
jgi:uncharacterized protein (DUF1501 family)